MSDVDEAFWNAFHAEITEIGQESVRLRAGLRPDRPEQEYFLHRLMMAYENAVGAALLGKAGLSTPLIAVARALFESVIATYWASLNDRNAAEAVAAAKREIMRIMRFTVSRGRAKFVNKETGAIENARVMEHPTMKEARRPKQLAEMADEAGIRNVYDMLYGMLSLFAHGTAAKMHMDAVLRRKAPIYESMSLVRSCVKAVALICTNQIEGRKTDHSALESILKVKLTD